METEVQVHTMMPTQIMAVSMEKNHLYIVSEFADGANLKELLFGEDVEVKKYFGKEDFHSKAGHSSRHLLTQSQSAYCVP